MKIRGNTISIWYRRGREEYEEHEEKTRRDDVTRQTLPYRLSPLYLLLNTADHYES
jgi:hypothetical protein